MARPQHANGPLSPENIPKGDFIDISTNKSVDPSRFQVFELPRQFLEWVLSKEPPRLDPEDLKDTARRLEVDRSKLVPPTEATPEPEFETTPVSLGPKSRVSKARQHSKSRSIEVHDDNANRTVSMRSHRPRSWLTHFALSAAYHRRLLFVLGMVAGCLFLILLWRHLDTSNTSTAPEASSQAASIPTEASASIPRAMNREATPQQSPSRPDSKMAGDSTTPRSVSAPSGQKSDTTSVPSETKSTGSRMRKDERTARHSPSGKSEEPTVPPGAGSAKPGKIGSQDKSWFPED